MMLHHGLLQDQPPPSIEVLISWLRERGVQLSDGVAITPMHDGTGWRLVATRDLAPVESIVKIPKTALLSTRTSSLPPLPSTTESVATTSHTILGLALALLHELRLGPDSMFWGYTQSLPRATVPVPPLWPLHAGPSAAAASAWLQGTEAERDLRRRQLEGIGLDSMRQFYAATAAHLPPTSLHPEPSSFEAFAHAYSLVSTRAFLIDLYHLVALCPFADILNHSAANHTSLAVDDFVCHRCGSLPVCEHGGSNPERLAHLGERERARLSDPDTVDMYVEMPAAAGEEVMNTYGDNLTESRLLVEWGFVPSEDDAADALAAEAATWEVEELLSPEVPGVTEVEVVAAAEAATRNLSQSDDALLCAPSRGVYHLNQAGQVSLRLFAALYARHAPLRFLPGDVSCLEEAWEQVQDGAEHVPLPTHVAAVAEYLCGLVRARLRGMHRPEMEVGEMFDLRDTLEGLEYMALTVAINERALLRSVVGRWEALLAAGIQA
ncbi:SET domain-containing protein [Cutaneotrichosporon oleaginosum]|uniref:SET domain-containing protein n=1 Tax=Cutaneotrichosporon oleaginosum TaxID=879819 RepID=A0A0J1B5H6_9TREE|nr:SET domain-containing protein [Cutaneotrichosporon oleaginosum]KLT42929.1 SET domain-containing protein [Cutaneotrichosporon oleaginosum]TXT12632.1 hypothetical protein COLE_03042 [Cutaneotrichosporon oleaginosum]